MSMAMPHAAKLRSQGRPEIAIYVTIFAVALWFIALFILQPRRRNTSGIAVVRGLGRLPLLVRYLLVAGLATGLFWVGIMYERIAA